MSNTDPAIANAAYIELHDCVGWLFADESAETTERRRHALTRIGAMRPATITEASFAAQVVALDLHRQDSLRLAAEHRNDVATAIRCRNNADALSRQALRIQARLEAMQQARRSYKPGWDPAKQQFVPPEQDVPIPDRAAPRTPEASPPEASRPEAAAPPQRPVEPAFPQPDQATPVAADFSPEALAKAEEYAKTHRMLAIRLRRAGGLTRQSASGFRPASLPQDAAVLRALAFGNTPILAALDAITTERNAA